MDRVAVLAIRQLRSGVLREVRRPEAPAVETRRLAGILREGGGRVGFVVHV